MKNFVARGDALEITASGDVQSGDVVAAGDTLGIAAGDIANGEAGIINLTGVYEVPKAGSQAWAVGDLVYWDGSKATKTAGTSKLLGIAAKAVGGTAGETIGAVRLSGPIPVSWGS